MLWRRISHDNKPGVHVIFEDDADIPEDFIAKLKECLPTLPENVDEYAYLGHNDLIGKTLDLPGSFWLEPENTNLGGANALLHCSLITAKGAASLLKFTWPVNHTDCTY